MELQFTKEQLIARLKLQNEEYDDLIKEAHNANCARMATKQKLAELIHNIRVGSVVLYRGKRFRVTKVRSYSDIGSRPWVEGNPMRKDGTYGTANRNLFNYWELVE